MAVIGAKGNFAGPGVSFDDAEQKRQEIVCSEVKTGAEHLKFIFLAWEGWVN